ncbi:hydrolase [Mesobacillus zeae]|uniref:Hydrolase n=1 Tax=Mesobacillus zeae TaxID=1917180 RepID=A0A398AWW5_9BACI|nr:hydrolase [Mesobacillus zeae]RID82071.1 hydrolase [Mesobacillus zeae]
MEIRNFRLDTEWNAVHYPDRPNGFGILIIGDERHFVESGSSFWTQNEGKRLFLKKIKDAGYTVFYSNLYGKNWGSNKAVTMTKLLYRHILRSEILNEKIHVLAEGMGALVALRLLQSNDIKIRSLLLINPILSLKSHLEQEKEHKFFHKKLIKELTVSHGIDIGDIEGIINGEDEPQLNERIPSKIIHVLSGNRAYRQSEMLNEYLSMWTKSGLPVSVTYMVPEKKLQLGSHAVKFWHEHEDVL